MTFSDDVELPGEDDEFDPEDEFSDDEVDEEEYEDAGEDADDELASWEDSDAR